MAPTLQGRMYMLAKHHNTSILFICCAFTTLIVCYVNATNLYDVSQNISTAIEDTHHMEDSTLAYHDDGRNFLKHLNVDPQLCLVTFLFSSAECYLENKLVCTPTHASVLCKQAFEAIAYAFRKEDIIILPPHDLKTQSILLWLDREKVDLSSTMKSECAAVVYPKAVRDRTCLLSENQLQRAKPSVVDLSHPIEIILQSINSICETFRTEKGEFNVAGLHRQYILDNLYTLVSNSQSLHSSEVFLSATSVPSGKMPMCEKIEAPSSWEEFYQKYLTTSHPVIIKNAIHNWPARQKWTRRFFMEKYGNVSVPIKMSPNSDYEGIEPVTLWDGHAEFIIPAKVKSQLLYPDLVVPRPAPVHMNFSEFLDLIQMIGNGSLSNLSAYLEYSSIRQLFKNLEADVQEMSFIQGKMKLHHLNIWLSDGDTLGKLHFDPYDNFLCQLSGRKEIILFEPHSNEQLYEAHIPEAQFSVNRSDWTFRRSHLMESTSMVMSPVDIKSVDKDRFPLFLNTRPLNCTIAEGEVLFMPSFWWHEVQSYRSQMEHRNLAVNFWYEPFFAKEFPCPECRLDINKHYHHML